MLKSRVLACFKATRVVRLSRVRSLARLASLALFTFIDLKRKNVNKGHIEAISIALHCFNIHQHFIAASLALHIFASSVCCSSSNGRVR